MAKPKASPSSTDPKLYQCDRAIEHSRTAHMRPLQELLDGYRAPWIVSGEPVEVVKTVKEPWWRLTWWDAAFFMPLDIALCLLAGMVFGWWIRDHAAHALRWLVATFIAQFGI